MKRQSYLLTSEPEFFEQLDTAVKEANCTRAHFIRDAVRQKLNHHENVMKPFFEKMKREQHDLEDNTSATQRDYCLD
jgi:metal-responsive CopG/Arc/MetJ family transcriptional regulator